MGRHAAVEIDRPLAPVGAPAPAAYPAPYAVHRLPVAPPVRMVPAPRPIAPVPPTTGFPRPAWVPPGYDAPPAGLDRPLDGPPVVWSAPRVAPSRPARAPRRATAVAGAVGAGVALLVTGGTALTALAQTAAPAAATAPAPHASATARQCSDAVADQLDDTASALATGSRSTWSSTVATRTSAVAAAYGRDSAEFAAYTAGAGEILDWLRDPSATESYETVVGRVVPAVVATCDRAYA